MKFRVLIVLCAVLCGPVGCVTKQAIDTFSFVPCSCRSSVHEEESSLRGTDPRSAPAGLADTEAGGSKAAEPRYRKGREERFAIWAAPILPVTLAMDLVTLPFQAFAFAVAIYLITGAGAA